MSVENALCDPGRVIEIAGRHSFRPIGEYYPGIRAGVSERIAMPLVEPLLDEMEKLFGLPRPPQYRECFLSIVTKSPSELAPIQCLPHFDGTGENRLAVLLYLDRAQRGGTAFYRQKATGFESVDEARFETYRTELAKAVDDLGIPPRAYIGGDTQIFAQTHRVQGIFNSMVIYRGNTLHCAALGRNFAPDSSPATGRLTLNLFLD